MNAITAKAPGKLLFEVHNVQPPADCSYDSQGGLQDSTGKAPGKQGAKAPGKQDFGNIVPGKARKQLVACGGPLESSYLLVSNTLLSHPLHAQGGEGVGTGSVQPDSIPAIGLTPSTPHAGNAPYPQTPSQTVIRFFHEFIPPTATAQTRRHTGKSTYLPAATARAAALLRAVVEPHAPTAPLSGPLSVGLLWTWPGSDTPTWKTTRPDLDNLAKLALDAMTKAGYWQDDSQVVEFTTAKFTGPIPGLAVTVDKVKVPRGEERTEIEVEEV